ncbi:indole-3-glycerol phosphate synthase TrpC [Pollutibacter soli]|uniref:indole-3-glycerol phosphate synthase TrpC n=1 Tax=Pollutibacter soli TaxID=3034157 RepID=UPI003013D9C6
MKDILKKIVDSKYKEIAERKQRVSVDELLQMEGFNRPVISLAKRFETKVSTGIIAEFKRKSPSKGIINDRSSVADVVSAYEKFGAAAVSVLTDEEYFGGSAADFAIARQQLNIPLLRKEFIVDEYQVVETKAMGADLILLIAACLSPADVKQLSKKAAALGLEILLELHDEDEIGHICDEITHVGINNRNLNSFSVNIDRSIDMAHALPAGKFRIAESGINSADQVDLFRRKGFDGFLIGENFMKEADPGLAFQLFTKNIKKPA